MRRRRISLAAGCVALAVVVAAAAGASRAIAGPASTASDGPGSLSHFDLARKDCLGTARNTTSKVWYTVANGVLSDVYYPTVDNTNVETLQYVVTDGSTFTDLQTRDMTYAVEALPESGGMACTVTATAKSGKYRIETQYVTDPGRNTVLMRVRMTPADAGYHLYVRFDPSVNGNGGGGGGNGGADSATVDTSTGHPVLVSSADGVGTKLKLAFMTGRHDTVGQDLVNHCIDDIAVIGARPLFFLDYIGAEKLEPQVFQQLLKGFAKACQAGGCAIVGGERQRRADGERLTRRRRRRTCARLRRLAWGRCRDCRGLVGHELREDARLVPAGLEGVRRWSDRPAHREARGRQGRRPQAARRRVLPERQRDQGVRGQDLPRRDRRQPRIALGPGDLGRRPREYVLRLLP